MLTELPQLEHNSLLLECLPILVAARSVWGVGLRSLGYLDLGFESRWGHGFVSCVYMLFSCVGSGLCDRLITRPEESYHASNCMQLAKQSSPATLHGGAWGERIYSSYSFLTSALDGVSGQRHAPAALCSHGIHCTKGFVGPRAGLDTEVREKILCLCRGSNPDRLVVQSVVRHYTYWATRLLCATKKPQYRGGQGSNLGSSAIGKLQCIN
jgi:hypothetical protein